MSLSDLVAYFNLPRASLCAHGSTFIPLASTDSTPFTQASSDARDFAIALPTIPVSVTFPSLTSTLVMSPLTQMSHWRRDLTSAAICESVRFDR